MKVCRGTSDLDRIEQIYLALEDRSNLCCWRHQIAIRVTWRQDAPHCYGFLSWSVRKGQLLKTSLLAGLCQSMLSPATVKWTCEEPLTDSFLAVRHDTQISATIGQE